MPLPTTVSRIRAWFRRRWECRSKRCSYYQHYLAFGPADLTHEGFHVAEQKCIDAQRRCEEYHERHPDRFSAPCCTIARSWERRVRA